MTKKSRTDYSILNIAAGLLGYTLNTIIGLICRMVFTRTLTADYLGVNGLFSNILSMLSLTELGIGTAIVYALYKPLAENDKGKIATLVDFYGKCYRVIGIIVAVVGLCLTPFLDILIDQQGSRILYLKGIYLLFLFNSASSYFFSYRSSLLMAAQRNYIVSGINYLVTIIQSIIQIILLYLTRNYFFYLITQIICTFVYNLVISYIAKRQFPFICQKTICPLEPDDKKSLTKNIRALVVWKFSGLLVNQTDSIIITYFSGLATVGLSSNYTLLSNTLNSLLNSLFNGITASVGNHNALESAEHKIQLFRAINFANFWLFGWASIGIALVSSDLVAVLFGNSYVLHWSIPFVIALNFYTIGMQGTVWTYENTMGLFQQGRYLLVLTAALNLFFSILLGKLWGLFGILFATFIARLLTNIWYDPYKLCKYGLHTSFRGYVKQYMVNLAVVLATGGICYALCSGFTELSILSVICKFLICSIVPNALFWLCFHKTESYAYLKEKGLYVVKKAVNRIHHG